MLNNKEAGMTEKMLFDENENTWLLTIPEIQSGGRYLPACTVVAIRTLKETYYPSDLQDLGPKLLTKRECSITLHWRTPDTEHEQKFVARYAVDLLDRTPRLDLTNDDFILEYQLRGRGLGTWIMQHLVSRAWTLPVDTPVKQIRTSPEDEDDGDNRSRRDHFWHSIGFRFGENQRLSLPLCIGDLQLPRGNQSTLRAVPINQGAGELIRICQTQKKEIARLESIRHHQAMNIRSLHDRIFSVVLIKGVMTIFTPVLTVFAWLTLIITTLSQKLMNRTTGK